MKSKKGISLIVLIITIIVIIILAGSVILSLSENNPIGSSLEARMKTNVDAYNSELSLFISKKYIDNPTYNPKEELYATTWDGTSNVSSTIKECISSMTAENGTQFSLQGGTLCYTGSDTNEIEMLTNMGVKYKFENKPVLTLGMTPIIWNPTTNNWDAVVNPDTNTNWYDYENGRWANARTNDGSMWVWLPRFAYTISTGFHTSTPGTIDIKFLDGNTDKDKFGAEYAKDYDSTILAPGSPTPWIVHPAFTFGTAELTGIWVAKFHATAREGLTNTNAGDNVKTKNVKISPGQQTWRNISVPNIFDVCRKMELDNTFGWGTTGLGFDTHLLKNQEWGAISYLALSKYGTNGVIIERNSDSMDCSTPESANSLIFYAGGDTNTKYITSQNRSTTRNVYGIYDMNASTYDSTASYVNNGSGSLTSSGRSLYDAPGKYKNVYESSGNTMDGNYSMSYKIKGDAIWETSNISRQTWSANILYMPFDFQPFFYRWNLYNSSYGTGLSSVGSFWGGVFYMFSTNGFRPAIVLSD